MTSAAVRARLKALRKKHGLGEFKKKGQVVSMARRRKSRSSRTSGRSSRRAPSYRKKSRRSGSLGMNKFIPLSGREHLLDFGIGAATKPISEWMAPYQAKYLNETFGEYADEAGFAIIGSVAHAFGGQLHPMVKDAGKELYRVAVISAGQTFGRNTIGSMKATGGNSASVYM